MAPLFFLSRPGRIPISPGGGRHAIFHKGSTLLRAPPPSVASHWYALCDF